MTKKIKNKLKSHPKRLASLDRGVAKGVSWRQDKRTSGDRGYTYEWQQARLEWLTAYPLCVMCLRRGRTEAATVVDHIIPFKGDMTLFWDRTNWQSLCDHCHNSHKQRQERGLTRRTYFVKPMVRVEHDAAQSACVDTKDGGDVGDGEGGLKVGGRVDT